MKQSICHDATHLSCKCIGRSLARRFANHHVCRYFLFAAALIILSNEFAGLYENEQYADSMRSAINIIEYCAVVDVQAQRMLYILKSFLADVEKHLKSSVPNEQSEPALPECHIGDPEEVLHTRRQSLTARRNHHHHHHQPSTPIGGGSSSDAMEYYHHIETDARHSSIHIPSMGPLVMRGERGMPSATSPTVPRRSNAPRSMYRRADLTLVKPDGMGIEQEFEEFDQISPADFQSPMDSEETKVYTHDYNSAMMSHGEQAAFQAHHGGGGFRGYSAPGVSSNANREAERAHFGGHYLYVDEK